MKSPIIIRFARWLFLQLYARIVEKRAPDIQIGPPDDLYLKRWHVIPRNRVFNIYLHQFLRSDDDWALHTHPWMFNCSFILDGRYWEHTEQPDGWPQRAMRNQGAIKFRWGKAPHRVELTQQRVNYGPFRPHPCWTLFITGPVVRNWGFLCPQGFVPWADFTKNNGSETGKGCDQ